MSNTRDVKGKKNKHQASSFKTATNFLRNKADKSMTEAKRKARDQRSKLKDTEGKLLGSAPTALAGFDYVIISVVIALCLFGLLMVFSASYYTTVEDSPMYYLLRQAVFMGVGLVGMLVVANIDYHQYYKAKNLFLIASLGGLVLVLLIGTTVNGAQRWINLGFTNITPSEFSKVLMICWTAVFLCENPESVHDKKGLLILWGVLLAHALLVMKQPNLSTAIVIAAVIFVIMLVGGISKTWILIVIGSIGAGAFGILKFMPKGHHWVRRLTSFIDPFADSQGDGYQVCQSLIAIGNGGIKGQGLGNSITKNLYLPEPQNDFILSIICEELGFIGFILLMLVYFFLLYRIILVALRSRDRLGFYLTTGVAVLLGLQVIINVAVVTSSMPATGITLPFISYGGTSIVTLMASIGIVLNVSRYNNLGKKTRR